jgi:glycine amidinotransferase
MSVVNSHNDWDVLEEVIVGGGFPTEFPSDDLTFNHFFHDNIFGKHINKIERWKIDKKYIEEIKEDLDNFSVFLAKNNIKVVRPKEPKSITMIKTAAFTSVNYPALNVRDLTLVIANKIIETPVGARWRQFENDYLKHIFLDYFKRGAQWVAAPRPILTDKSLDMSRVYQTKGAREFYEKLISPDHDLLDCGYEIIFDAANCVRLGKNIIINAPTENERLGAKWLQQQVGDQYEVWPVSILDNHLDSIFLPVKPGLAVITLPIIDKLPKPLQKWDFIKVPTFFEPKTENNYIPLASEKIFCNFLSLSPETIICQPEYAHILSKKLKPYNVNVESFRIRHTRLFGGGHHCLTLDIRRASKLENYF